MQIQQLEYIVEVAKSGSMTAAAANLHVSVATLSQSIAKSEELLGVKIFNRSRIGTSPTDQGKRIVELSYEIKNKLLELEEEMRAYNTQESKELKIASSPSVLLTMLPKTLALFKKTHHQIDITIQQDADVIEIMSQNETDIGFISANDNNWVKWGNLYKNTLHFDTLSQARMTVCVSKHSPLAFKDSVTPEELLDQTLALYTITNPIYKDILRQYGDIKVLFQTSNTEIIKKVVQEGIAVSFLSDLIIKNDPSVLNGDIVPIPLVNYERANITYGWVRSKKRRFSPTSRKFIKTMTTLLEKGRFEGYYSQTNTPSSYFLKNRRYEEGAYTIVRKSVNFSTLNLVPPLF